MELVSQQEQKNKRYGMLTSTVIHTVILILFILPFLTYPDPPPGQEGILVNLGIPDIGQGDENSGPSQPIAEAEVEPEQESEPTPTREVQEKPVETKPQPREDIVRTEDPDAIALKKQQQEEARKKAEADAQKRAQAEAKRRAEAEQAKREADAQALKDQLAGGLSGSGGGKGNTGTAGSQGDPNGDPNASKLEGISTGSGRVGGGLGNRGVSRQGPGVQDNSQSVGNAVIRVCVDRAGNVTEAEFTQKGSSIADGSLKNKAISDAKKWKFAPGDVDVQCGTITYRFSVQ